MESENHVKYSICFEKNETRSLLSTYLGNSLGVSSDGDEVWSGSVGTETGTTVGEKVGDTVG